MVWYDPVFSRALSSNFYVVHSCGLPLKSVSKCFNHFLTFKPQYHQIVTRQSLTSSCQI